MTETKKTQWWRKGVGVWGEGADYKIHRTFVPFEMVMFSFIFLQSFNKIVRFFLICIFNKESWNFIFENDWKLVSLTATLKQLFNSIYYLMVQCVFAVPRYNYYVKMNGRFVFTSISWFALWFVNFYVESQPKFVFWNY